MCIVTGNSAHRANNPVQRRVFQSTEHILCLFNIRQRRRSSANDLHDTTHRHQVQHQSHGLARAAVQPGSCARGVKLYHDDFPNILHYLVEVDVQVVSAAVDTALVVVTFDNNAYTAYI